MIFNLHSYPRNTITRKELVLRVDEMMKNEKKKKNIIENGKFIHRAKIDRNFFSNLVSCSLGNESVLHRKKA